MSGRGRGVVRRRCLRGRGGEHRARLRPPAAEHAAKTSITIHVEFKYIIAGRGGRVPDRGAGKGGERVAELRWVQGLSGHLPFVPFASLLGRPHKFRGARTASCGRISEGANATLVPGTRRSRRQVRGIRGTLSQALQVQIKATLRIFTSGKSEGRPPADPVRVVERGTWHPQTTAPKMV